MDTGITNNGVWLNDDMSHTSSPTTTAVIIKIFPMTHQNH